MIYKAIDKWNGNYLEHRDHKYIAREKINGTYRYFYDQDEYEAYLRGSGKLKGDGITGRLRGDQAEKNRKHATLGERTIDLESPNKLYSMPQSSTGLKKPSNSSTVTVYSQYGTSRYDSFVTPSVDKSDPDPRWAINQSYKPKATKAEKAIQAAKNKAAKLQNKKKKFSVRNFLSQFTRKGK